MENLLFQHTSALQSLVQATAATQPAVHVQYVERADLLLNFHHDETGKSLQQYNAVGGFILFCCLN